MQRIITLGVLACALMVAPLSAPTAGAAPSGLSIAVGGTDVGVYPAFDPAIHRYAVTTSSATAGTVSVAITGTTGATVDGRATQKTTLTGLNTGDEIGVRANGSSYSFIYMPAGFPTLKTTTNEPGVQPGYVALTLNQFVASSTPAYDAIVDRQGVPVWVTATGTNRDMDLKRQPDGSLTLMRPTDGASSELVTLDDQYRPVGTPARTVGLDNTDAHDSWVFEDGSKILTAYVPNSGTGKTDAVIQKLDASGHATFTWDSSALADESLYAGGDGKDYAHINSVWPLPDGDIVASFRHLSAVLRIATTDHDGYQPGDIVWKLGGRDSSFAFPDAGFEGGPCAQHTASDWTDAQGKEHVLVFDDGSNEFSGAICTDPTNTAGPAILRPQTRVTEYVLDPVAGTATVAWNYAPTNVSTIFAGSAYRMGNGNTLIGWSKTPYAIASEVSRSKQLLWQLEDARPATDDYQKYMTYRAMLVTAPDRIKPVVSVTAPVEGKTYPAFTSPADFSCSDRGGSNLVGCSVRDASGSYAPGKHTMTVTSTDGAGNVTAVVRHFTMTTDYWPEASATVNGHTVGASVHGSWKQQLARVKLGRNGRTTARISLLNGGSKAERLVLAGNAGTKKFAVRYLVAGVDRTRAIASGRFRTATVAPGKKIVVTLVIRRLRPAHHGDLRAFHLTATSTHDASRKDGVGLRVTAR